MLHTIYITQKINSNIYYKLIKINDIKKIENGNFKQEFVTSYLKSEGLSKIKLSRTTINYTNKKTNKTNQNDNYLIGIQLNPKRLIEKIERLEITKYEDIQAIEKQFNILIKNIDPNLKLFMDWTLRRIDYCTYINTPYVKDYIKLFQNGDKPANFKDGVYTKKSKRYKQVDGSMYYTNKSGNIKINFYDKQDQLITEKSKGFDISDKEILDAKDYLRIEIQLDKLKTDGIKRKYKFETKELKNFISPNMSLEYLTKYYKQTTGKGDYYKLEDSIKIINKSNHKNNKKNKLINILKLSNKKRSVWKARQELLKGVKIDNIEFKVKKNTFDNYKKDINNLGINLTTIPSRWEIDKLECLLEQIKKNLTNNVDDNIELVDTDINFKLK